MSREELRRRKIARSLAETPPRSSGRRHRFAVFRPRILSPRTTPKEYSRARLFP